MVDLSRWLRPGSVVSTDIETVSALLRDLKETKYEVDRACEEIRRLRKENDGLRKARVDRRQHMTASQIAMAEAGKVTRFMALEDEVRRLAVEIEELRYEQRLANKR